MEQLFEFEQESNSPIMQHIEALSGKLENCGLLYDNLTEVKDSILVLSEYLGVTDLQAILFTAILSLNFKRRRVSVDHLSKFLGCSGLLILNHLPELKVLQQKRWIRTDSDAENRRSMLNDISYYVIRDVIDRIMQGSEENESAGQKDIYKVLSEIMDLAVDFDKERICYFEMMEEVRDLMNANDQLPYIKLMRQQSMKVEEELLFMLVCQRTLTGSPEVELEQLANIVSGSSYEGISLKRSIIREKSRLITQNLIKLQDGMFRNDKEIILTDRAIQLFFSEDADLLIKNSVNSKDVIQWDTIQHVKLFFNESEHSSMERLRKLLSKRGYNSVVKRLKEQNMRSGFTVLFHGAPGTGKTESVYQLALRSGRDVMMVDLSQTKSMWFGESEKKLKEIFNQYRTLLRYADNAPILLFNEADGVFGTRMNPKNSSSAQAFNTMQNILLEELENFEGILIATTNLTSNFDRAFERRFLYKIAFSPPDAETRRRIWQSKILGLTARVATALSREHSLSGGQIENVTRKFMINRVLYKQEASYETLSAYCREEQLYKPVHRSVGFKATG